MIDIITLAVGCLTLKTLISMYINVLQFKEQFKKNPNKDYMSDEDHKFSTRYEKAKRKFCIIVTFLNYFKDVYLLPKFLEFYSYTATFKYVNSDVFFSTAVIYFETVINMVFDFYYDFVLEESFGFNKKSVFLFVSDFLKSSAISIIITYPFLSVIFYLMKTYEHFYLYVGVAFIIFQVIMVLLYPTVIAPLFNTFTPMTEEHELYQPILELSKKLDFSVSKIYVVDGSKRSAHSNAYFTGFGKTKQIVLYDTILNHLKKEETMAVLGHEFGHYKCNHIMKQILLSFITTVSTMYLFFLYSSKCTSFPLSIKLIFFMTAFSPISVFITFISNYFTRLFEKEADAFAVQYGYGEDLKSALCSLFKENKGTILVNWLYGVITLTHPPLLERVEYIDSLLSKME